METKINPEKFDFNQHALECRAEVDRIIKGIPIEQSTFRFRILKDDATQRRGSSKSLKFGKFVNDHNLLVVGDFNSVKELPATGNVGEACFAAGGMYVWDGNEWMLTANRENGIIAVKDYVNGHVYIRSANVKNNVRYNIKQTFHG